MGLSLMIFNVAQFHLREALRELDLTVPNQKKKEISNPTLKWIFYLFKGVDVIEVSQGDVKQSLVSNIKDYHRKIIQCFGKYAMEIYGLSDPDPLFISFSRELITKNGHLRIY